MKARAGLLFLILLLALVLIPAFRVARPFLWPVFTAMVLAVALWPLHSHVLRWLKRPALAALVTTLGTLLIGIAVLVAVGATFTGELTEGYDSLRQQSVAEGGWKQFFTHLIEPPLAWLSRWVPISAQRIQEEMLERLQTFAAAALKGAGAFVTAITASIGHIILSFIILYFFLRDGAKLTGRMVDSLPIPRAHTEHLMEIVSNTITANVYGVFAVSGTQGLLTAIGFWFSGFQSPVTWGLIACLCSMIPIVGVALVWIPAAIILFAKGSILKGIIFVLWSVLVVGMSDNIIRPWLVLGRVKQHPLLVLFSILGGTQAFGLTGLILGPVVVAVTIALVQAIRVELDRQTSEDEEMIPTAPPAG